MPRPHVFSADTALYHPIEGKRVFPKGETDPGPMWTDRIGGEVVGMKTTTQALKDLIAAQEQIEHLETRLMASGRDLDETAKTREEALAKLAGVEQELIKSQAAQADAEALATQYMRERDDARKQFEQAGAGRKPAEVKA